MFPWNPLQWTELYLRALVGQPESSRLEFKSGRALASKKDKEKFMRDHLSPTVSAFANSEGGILVIGMVEDRASRPRVASHLDGIEIGPENAIESPEQFQQMVDSCISPFLPGLSVRRVPLSGNLQGRSALIVHVPKGSTAYQAKNHIYYSRCEFETKSMPDHEVRLRMHRGRAPQAVLQLRRCQCTSAEEEFNKRTRKKEKITARREAGEKLLYGRAIPTREELEAPKRDFDEYSLQMAVMNTGEMTIRDFVLAIRFVTPDERVVFVGERNPKIGNEYRYRFLRAGDMGMPNRTPEKKLFPGDYTQEPDHTWVLRISSGSAMEAGTLIAEWKIFLDDAAPISGIIDLGIAFQEAAQAGNDD